MATTPLSGGRPGVCEGDKSSDSPPMAAGRRSAAVGSEERHEGDTIARTSAAAAVADDSTSAGGGVGDSGSYDYHAAANRFRSNIEIVEKPRQMIVLLATIAGASYLVSDELATIEYCCTAIDTIRRGAILLLRILLHVCLLSFDVDVMAEQPMFAPVRPFNSWPRRRGLYVIGCWIPR